MIYFAFSNFVGQTKINIKVEPLEDPRGGATCEPGHRKLENVSVCL